MKHVLAAVAFLLTIIQPAFAKQENTPYSAVLQSSNQAPTLSCRMLEDEYADYRRKASRTLNVLREPYYFILVEGMAPAKLDDGWLKTDVDYAARALSDDIHDIPMMFTHIGKPEFTTFFGLLLEDLDQRQRQLCGYNIR